MKVNETAIKGYVETIAEDLIATIQKDLGVTSGDDAAVFFDDPGWRGIKHMMATVMIRYAHWQKERIGPEPAMADLEVSG